MTEYLGIIITLLALLSFGWLFRRIRKRLRWRYRRCRVLLRRYRRYARLQLSAREETFLTKDGLVLIERRRFAPPVISYFYRKERPSILWWQMAHRKLELTDVQESKHSLRLLLRDNNGALRSREIPARMRNRFREGLQKVGLLKGVGTSLS